MCGKQAEMFKVLGVESRIKIIELLKERGPLGVSELAERLALTPSAVSQHLKVLKYAGLVRNERKGYWIPYEVDPSALMCCQDFLSEVCRCGCTGGGRMANTQEVTKEDEIARLKKHEEYFEKHLKEIRARIEELGKEG
jgi:DNA-binding transcriptional ArsR family regulator